MGALRLCLQGSFIVFVIVLVMSVNKLSAEERQLSSLKNIPAVFNSTAIDDNAFIGHVVSNSADPLPPGHSKKNCVAVLLADATLGSNPNYRTMGDRGLYYTMDMMAVQAHEIRRIHPRVELVALVQDGYGHAVRTLLHDFGWRIINVSLAQIVQISQIQNEEFRRDIVHDGALGAAELIKLLPWVMEEYDNIVVVDCDVQFHRNFDTLFSIHPEATLLWTMNPIIQPSRKRMESVPMHEHTVSLNGGFFVVRPNRSHYMAMVRIVREGNYTKEKGWGGSGHGTLFGGRTIQGLLLYYFHYVLGGAGTLAVQLDTCQFNNMLQSECTRFPVTSVVANHFTHHCHKPFTCLAPRVPLCHSFTKKWWDGYVLFQKYFREIARNRTKGAGVPSLVDRCRVDSQEPGSDAKTHVKIARGRQGRVRGVYYSYTQWLLTKSRSA